MYNLLTLSIETRWYSILYVCLYFLYKNKISSSSVAICGLGGLGSNIAILLARAGVGKLILIDFDKVDITNLHRQQYKVSQVGMYKTEALRENLTEINPYLETEIQTVCVTEENAKELLKDCNIICEAFDNAECKAMLTNLVLEEMPEKTPEIVFPIPEKKSMIG